MNLKRWIAAVVGGVVLASQAQAGPPLKLVSWGELDPTWLKPPSDLPELVEIHASHSFVVGLGSDGRLFGWGYFAYPDAEFFIPADVDRVELVRLGPTGVLVVKDDGSVRVWGVGMPQLVGFPPIGLTDVVDGGLGYGGALALRADGTVVAWGGGQLVDLMPSDLGPCIAVGVSGETGVAITEAGDIRCWVSGPLNCEPVGGIRGPVDSGPFFAGARSALTDEGSVITWGTYSHVPPPPSSELQGCARLRGSAQGDITAAVRADGVGFVWGLVQPGAGVPSPQTGAIRDIAPTGYRTFALIDEFTDCNGNGLDDSAEIESGTALDCNGDWIPDTCQFASGEVEDCNANGIADACEKSAPFAAESGELGPIGYQSPQSWTVHEVPAAATHVTLSLAAKGDFSSVSEYAIVRLNGEAIGVAFINGTDCTEIGPEDFTIFAATFNGLVGAGGDATFTFEPTIAVNANSCPSGTWVKATLSYNGATELDCNANGLLDACEIAAGYSADCNLDGIPDACQVTTADCNGNGTWDACDIASGAAIDCNGNGVPDSCDIGSSGAGDCNGNGQFDECEIASGATPDCDGNGRPDSCDLVDGTLADCDGNGKPDGCDIASGAVPDCNANGIPDACDIDAGTVGDINNNGVPDECEGLDCPGDITGDHLVNGADLAVLLGFWGPVGTFASADIDGSGTVDAGDLAILLGGWGVCK